MSSFARSRRRRPSDSEIDLYVAALAAARIFATAPKATVRRLAESMDRFDVPAGRDVVREGRIPTYFYVVGSGLLDVVSTGEGAHDAVKVNSLQEGDHFGEIGLLEGMPATATVRAHTDCVLYRIPAANFLAEVAASPALSSVLLDRVAGGLAKTHPSYAPAAGGRGEARGDRLLQDIARLADMVGPALRPPGEDELLKAVTSTALSMFDAAACSLALVRPDGSLQFRAASGAGASSVVGRVVAAGAGIAGAVVAERKPLVISDVESDERFAAGFADATGYRPRSIAARPLERGRGVLGVIEVLDAPAFRDDPDAAMLRLDLFAGLAATAIENGRIFSDLGTSLLAAAAEAAQGTGLDAALERAVARTSLDPDAARLAVLVQRVMELDPPRRQREIAALADRLGVAGSRGSPARD